MNWIQGLLIAAILALLVHLLRSRTNATAKAWVKVGYLLFVIAAIYAILRPDDTTVVANWLGVDRGADLLSYALVIAFLFTTLSTYLRFKNSRCATPGWRGRWPCRARGRRRSSGTGRESTRLGAPPRRPAASGHASPTPFRPCLDPPMNLAAPVTSARVAATITQDHRGTPVQSWRCQSGRPRVCCHRSRRRPSR